MDFQALPALSLPLLVQDALIAVGAGVALLAASYSSTSSLAAGTAHVAR